MLFAEQKWSYQKPSNFKNKRNFGAIWADETAPNFMKKMTIFRKIYHLKRN